jgi:hypothetical protein
MAEPSDTVRRADLMLVAPEAEVEGEPRVIYTFQADTNHQTLLLRSYSPSDEGAPRLVANLRGVANSSLGVAVGHRDRGLPASSDVPTVV